MPQMCISIKIRNTGKYQTSRKCAENSFDTTVLYNCTQLLYSTTALYIYRRLGVGRGEKYTHAYTPTLPFISIQAPLAKMPAVWKEDKIEFKLSFSLRSYVHQIVMLFRTFSPRLEDNDKLKYSSDNFP